MLSMNAVWAVGNRELSQVWIKVFFLTSEVQRVTLLDCSGGLEDASVQAFD